MSAHLLSLSALHAAGPGVLDVVFGADGDFSNPPLWAGPLTSIADPRRRGWLVWRGALHVSVATDDGHWPSSVENWREKWALDCRSPSVAARLLKVCLMVPANQRDMIPFSRRQVDALLYGFGAWTDKDAAHVATLTLTLAPRIAALGGSK